MQYRQFGKLNWKVSALGFGCMRLPTRDGTPQSPNIDEGEAIRMIRQAIDQGVNYVDTAYVYNGGNSETVLGKALRDGYRKKVKLATKSPVWMIRQPADFDKYLNEQLKRLQTDRIDFYLLHSLDKEEWEQVVLRQGILARVEAALRDGRIGGTGFSFHDRLAAFKQIVDGYNGWTLCQIQYNYMDTQNQAGSEGLEYAAAKGLAVVVMEPLLGGRLANPPETVREIFKQADKGRSPADWALQWVWDQPEVSLLLSGMSTMEQVQENIRSAGRSRIHSLTAAELKFIERVRTTYQGKIPIPCTLCGYCLPCPNGVNIPRNFELFNNGFIHEDPRSSRAVYSRFMEKGERAGACIKCRICEEKCPQKIVISEWLPKVHAVLGEGKPY